MKKNYLSHCFNQKYSPITITKITFGIFCKHCLEFFETDKYGELEIEVKEWDEYDMEQYVWVTIECPKCKQKYTVDIAYPPSVSKEDILKQLKDIEEY